MRFHPGKRETYGDLTAMPVFGNGRPSFELVLASARLGADSNLLCDSTGAKPYGVVDTVSWTNCD